MSRPPLLAPDRFVHLDAARVRFGPRVDRLGPLFFEGDALADAAAEALVALPPAEREAQLRRALAGRPTDGVAALDALLASLSRAPVWFDPDRADRGGALFLRSGPLGGLVLAFRSLVLGYCSPAGNKPLAFSGRLIEGAADRLSETSRFVEAVCLPRGLLPQAPGFAAALRVRLMHAQVRRLLRDRPVWRAQAWGAPINQVDMAGTVLLFSWVVVGGLRRLGFPVSVAQSEDLLHLWRYAGYLLGVREELLCATEREAAALFEMIVSTQQPPDDDSRALARALLESPVHSAHTAEERASARRFSPLAYGLSRSLLGDGLADALGYPRTRWRYLVPAVRAGLMGATTLARWVPGVDRAAFAAGVAYWRRAVELGLQGRAARFQMPEALAFA